MRNNRSKTALGTVLWIVLVATTAIGSPLDLRDPTPRWVEVRFEISPENEPGRLNGNWSRARPAFLEPADEQGLVRIRVPAREIEEHLRANGTQTIDGSFSEFVWTLDSATGHVVRAELSGRVRQPLAIGLIRTTKEVEIRVEMTTRVRAGFRPASRFFGQRTHGFCAGGEDSRDCTLVPAHPLDPGSGYVNAIGSVQAQIPLAKYRVFSPLGEARFNETSLHGTGAVISGTARSGTSRSDAVCSVSFSGSCGPDLGGES